MLPIIKAVCAGQKIRGMVQVLQEQAAKGDYSLEPLLFSEGLTFGIFQ
jgi:hypothetical protein